jgi:hypothetical protein
VIIPRLDTSPETVMRSSKQPMNRKDGRDSSGIELTSFRTTYDNENVDALKIDIDLGLDNDHLNNTQTHALLNIEHDKFDQILQ